MTYQLVPPHDHRQNKAEKAIQTFKDHFVAILYGADTSFPLNLWDLLLRQAEHTLNMLRPSRMTPTVSSYTYLWRQHDYNANPFATLGCKVESHLVPGIRETWAPHSKRILCRNIVGTLPMPQSIHHRHPPHTYVQLGILQTLEARHIAVRRSS